MDWSCYISIAKTASKKIGALICSMEFLSPAGLARKKKAGAWSPLTFFYPKWVVSNRWPKNNILTSLCLASCLAENWLQKLETKHCLFWRSYFCSYVCMFVCVCVCGISVWLIYNKTKLPFCKMSVFDPYT